MRSRKREEDKQDVLSKKVEPTLENPPDGGWGWVVCLACFYVQFVVIGLQFAFGVIYTTYLDPRCAHNTVGNASGDGTNVHGNSTPPRTDCGGFGEGRGKTAWVTSICLAIIFATSLPIAGILSDKFGSRPVVLVGALLSATAYLVSSYMTELSYLYLSYGLLAGIGFGLVYMPSVLTIGQYFKRKRGFAYGLACAGADVGTVTMAPVTQVLLDCIQWQGAFRVYSGLALSLVVASLVYQPLPTHSRTLDQDKEVEKQEQSRRHVCIDFSLWINPLFLTATAANGLMAFGFLIPYVHLVKHAEDMNIEPREGALLITYIGISSILGRVVLGRAADHPLINRLYVVQLSIAIAGVANIVCPFFTNYSGLIFYSLLFGMFNGAAVSLMPALLVDYLGIQKFAQALGLMLGAEALAVLLGPPSAGWIYDSTHSYHIAFYLSGAAMVSGAIVLAALPCLRRKMKRKAQTKLIAQQGQQDLDHAPTAIVCRTESFSMDFRLNERSCHDLAMAMTRLQETAQNLSSL
ncbi:monocarboxylate transporter 12-like [Corticium candelabrum]|uniref:monocarboxylate transporter 12-like n=1 Tax=Corticium candelabrum TaxID=121492 RepID=UPI002E2596B2|nr:monocarboxylate transporter 12-like [Corticium candelabrum]